MRELQDLWEIFPYCLLVALPIMIILSPAAEAVGQEFPAHRLAQYELGGVGRGSKMAAISMEARAVPRSSSAVNLLRKVIVAKLEEMHISTLNDVISSGAGGILLIVPSVISKEAHETVESLEEYLMSTEFEIPIYFAQESDQLFDLLSSLSKMEGSSSASSSAAQALFSSISLYGYQLVTATTAVPKAISDPYMTSIEAVLEGDVGDETQQTVVVVAHYDSKSPAPSLSFGSDNNGSGVALLMELARLFGKLYSNPRTRPPMNLAFLLTSGGKLNYFGSKKWLEHHFDHESNSDWLANLPFVICLEALAGPNINMHVSKPPKEDSHPGKFMKNLQPDKLVHKKINLAEELLAWEHERFSIRRLPAFTLSRLDTRTGGSESASLTDVSADPDLVRRQVKRIGEALACTLYEYAPEGCSGQVLNGSLSPSLESVRSWIAHLDSNPRFASLTASKSDPFVASLSSALKSYLGADRVRALNFKREVREPEFVLFDNWQTTVTAYRVKPAVFDLFLTLSIAAYLGVVYFVILKSGSLVSFLACATATKAGSVNGNGHAFNGNGHLKVK